MKQTKIMVTPVSLFLVLAACGVEKGEVLDDFFFAANRGITSHLRVSAGVYDSDTGALQLTAEAVRRMTELVEGAGYQFFVGDAKLDVTGVAWVVLDIGLNALDEIPVRAIRGESPALDVATLQIVNWDSVDVPVHYEGIFTGVHDTMFQSIMKSTAAASRPANQLDDNQQVTVSPALVEALAHDTTKTEPDSVDNSTAAFRASESQCPTPPFSSLVLPDCHPYRWQVYCTCDADLRFRYTRCLSDAQQIAAFASECAANGGTTQRPF